MHNRAVFMASTVVIFLAVKALWLTIDARFESQLKSAVNTLNLELFYSHLLHITD